MSDRYPEPPSDFDAGVDDVEAPHFFARLEHELVSAVGRQQRRRVARRRRVLAAATVVVGVAGISIASLSFGVAPAESAVQIERTVDGVVVIIDGPITEPERFLDELADAGIDATFSRTGASRRRDGVIVGLSADIDIDILSDRDGDGLFDRIEIPEDFGSPLDFVIGTADPTRTEVAPVDCDAFLTRSVADARDELDELYPEARWTDDRTHSGGPVREVDPAEVPDSHQITGLIDSGSDIIIITEPVRAEPQTLCDV